jgi:hypothetical protein
MDFRFGDVIEHPYLPNPEAVLRSLEATQPLDTAPAQLGRLVSKVQLDTVSNLGPRMSRETGQLPSGVRRHDDLEAHSS